MKLLRWLRRAASDGGIVLVGFVVLAVIAAFYLGAPDAVGLPEPSEDKPPLNLPAAAVDIEPSDIACRATRVEKLLNPIAQAFTYRAWSEQDGATVYLQWTDAPGVNDLVFVEMNGESARPQIDTKTADCLRKRAQIREGPGS